MWLLLCLAVANTWKKSRNLSSASNYRKVAWLSVEHAFIYKQERIRPISQFKSSEMNFWIFFQKFGSY